MDWIALEMEPRYTLQNNLALVYLTIAEAEFEALIRFEENARNCF